MTDPDFERQVERAIDAADRLREERKTQPATHCSECRQPLEPGAYDGPAARCPDCRVSRYQQDLEDGRFDDELREAREQDARDDAALEPERGWADDHDRWR